MARHTSFADGAVRFEMTHTVWQYVRYAIVNLLINANKYSPEDGSIDINVMRQHGKVELTVSDTGPGIPESEHHRVFDRFYRVGGDRHSSQVSGCGLGLSIVKHIAELHGAQIELSSPPGQSGLVVTVVFHGQTPAGQLTGRRHEPN